MRGHLTAVQVGISGPRVEGIRAEVSVEILWSSLCCKFEYGLMEDEINGIQTNLLAGKFFATSTRRQICLIINKMNHIDWTSNMHITNSRSERASLTNLCMMSILLCINNLTLFQCTRLGAECITTASHEL